MVRIIFIYLVVSLMIITSGCSSENLTNEKTMISNEQEPETESKDNENRFVVTNENITTLFNKSSDVNIVKELGSAAAIRLNRIEVTKLEIREGYRDVFDGKDIVTLVNLEVELENKSGKSINLYPLQGKITTNTKEEKSANTFFSDDLDGEITDETTKKGNVIFLMDSEAEDLVEFKYTINIPIDSYGNKSEEDIIFDLFL